MWTVPTIDPEVDLGLDDGDVVLLPDEPEEDD
jgi:hypothetical protein